MPYLVALCIVIFSAFVGWSVSVVKENERLKAEVNEANEMIVRQNEAIEQIALDTAEYACSVDSLNDYAASKYEKIIHEHEEDTCENKLKSLEEALNIFNEVEQ